MLMKQDTKRQLLKVDKEASAAREKAYQDYVMQYEMAVAKQRAEKSAERKETGDYTCLLYTSSEEKCTIIKISFPQSRH